MKKVNEELKTHLVELKESLEDTFDAIFDKITKNCFINLIENSNNLKIVNNLKKNIENEENSDQII